MTSKWPLTDFIEMVWKVFKWKMINLDLISRYRIVLSCIIFFINWKICKINPNFDISVFVFYLFLQIHWQPSMHSAKSRLQFEMHDGSSPQLVRQSTRLGSHSSHCLLSYGKPSHLIGSGWPNDVCMYSKWQIAHCIHSIGNQFCVPFINEFTGNILVQNVTQSASNSRNRT